MKCEEDGDAMMAHEGANEKAKRGDIYGEQSESENSNIKMQEKEAKV